MRRGGYFLCTEPTDGRAQDIDQKNKHTKRDNAEQEKGGDAVHFKRFEELIALGAEAFVFKAEQIGNGLRSGRRDAEECVQVNAEGMAYQADGVDRGVL